MIRSMMSGISGLRSHQTAMDVIGNNIANVNTTGFKASRVTFKEVFSNTIASATAPNSENGTGGKNPMQVGMGTSVASVDLLYTTGSIERTDNGLDVSIDGSGLFVIKDGNNSGYTFTRAGMFGVDKSGNLVTSSGALVCGWQTTIRGPEAVEADGFDTTLLVEPINIYMDNYNGNKKIISPKATDQVVFTGNVNSSNNAGDTVGIPMTLYDSYGNEIQGQMSIIKSEDPAAVNTWDYELTLIDDPTTVVAMGELTFEDDTSSPDVGKITSMTSKVPILDGDGNPVLDGEGNPTYTVTTLKDPNDPAKNIFNRTVDILYDDVTGSEGTIKFDFSALTQYASADSASVFESNGFATGTLLEYSIGADGVITGVYSNGKQQSLGMIALANFDNPEALKKVGDSAFTQTANSGEFRAVPPATVAGELVSNTLELSNVDLSTEFTQMIIVQRGFQANSRIITTADELLQELVNLKR